MVRLDRSLWWWWKYKRLSINGLKNHIVYIWVSTVISTVKMIVKNETEFPASYLFDKSDEVTVSHDGFSFRIVTEFLEYVRGKEIFASTLYCRGWVLLVKDHDRLYFDGDFVKSMKGGFLLTLSGFARCLRYEGGFKTNEG